jgi:hypothetical protein
VFYYESVQIVKIFLQPIPEFGVLNLHELESAMKKARVYADVSDLRARTLWTGSGRVSSLPRWPAHACTCSLSLCAFSPVPSRNLTTATLRQMHLPTPVSCAVPCTVHVEPCCPATLALSHAALLCSRQAWSCYRVPPTFTLAYSGERTRTGAASFPVRV